MANDASDRDADSESCDYGLGLERGAQEDYIMIAHSRERDTMSL
jgi:hypothetical protein